MRRSVWPLALALLITAIPSVAFADCDAFAEAQQRGWLWLYLGAFAAGFQTSLTPCVYPMIPITLGIFGARGKDVSRGKALLLATFYVVGMGLMYAAFGVVVSLVGGQFGSQLDNPFLVVPIVLLLAALAASMFGAFELNLPASWQARLNQVGGRGFRGAFAMGLVGGLIAAPCTGPFLLGILTLVAKQRSVLGGGSLLFVYAIGIGVLFWVLAAFAMSLPKSGAWMEWVKSIGGILLMLGALYFLVPLLPFMREFAVPETWFLATSIALIVAGLAVGAVHLSFHGSPIEKLRKGIGIALVLGGAFAVWSYTLAPKLHLPHVEDEEAAFAKAHAEGKGVMIDFAATWCAPCRELEREFGDEEIYDLITKNFVVLKFDVSAGNAVDQERQDRFNAGLPTVVYQSSDRKTVARIDKKLKHDEVLETVKRAVAQLRAGTALAAGEPCK